MIRMFSRRRTNRVPLGLDMRLESVEMLNSALMRRRRESIRTFRGDRRRREVCQYDCTVEPINLQVPSNSLLHKHLI
jgi:hypothetical protein